MIKEVIFKVRNKNTSELKDLSQPLYIGKFLRIQSLINSTYINKDEKGKYIGRAKMTILDVMPDRIITIIQSTNCTKLKGIKSKFGILCAESALPDLVYNKRLFESEEHLIGSKQAKVLLKNKAKINSAV